MTRALVPTLSVIILHWHDKPVLLDSELGKSTLIDNLIHV